MIGKLQNAINDFSLLCGVKKIIVALSGGADSVALLHSMLNVCSENEIKLEAAHLNHCLRGEESDRDELFCVKLCEKLGVKLYTRREDINSYAAATKQSIELAARDKRYEFFNDICTPNTVVATAHTASDNLETVIYNLTRGTALKGLCGIPPKRDIFIRPLIYCTRTDIENYCKENNLDYVTDSTNLTDDYTRNVIRHKVVSVLKQINESVEANAVNTANSLRYDSAYLTKQADIAFNELYDGESIDTKGLNSLDYAIKSRVVARLLEINGCSVSATLVNKICDLSQNDFPKFSVKKDIYCSMQNGRLRLVSDLTDNTDYKVQIEEISLKDFEKLQKINSLLLKNTFDYDKIVGKPVIRTRIEGDSLKLPGRPQKTFKKLYNECKIPVHLRKNLPVIADEKGVVWVMDIGVCERARVTKNSKKIGLIKYLK
ncbi:MAG: tRNA lysidine(34) synthetase TilS [Clostridia bacterium]|nr:tRNA lysidine(34) synthetase TilS [Clostridia bacterium]